MKKLYFLLLLLPMLALSQKQDNKYDYFVQFNSSQFAKKVNIDSLFSHKLFNNYNRDSADLKLTDLISYLDKTQNVTIHGQFRDSLAFTQLTFGIVDDKKITAIIEKQIKKSASKDKIVKKSKYSIYSPSADDYSVAWNKKHLIYYFNYADNLTPFANLGVAEETSGENYETVIEADFEALEDVVEAVEEVDETEIIIVEDEQRDDIIYESTEAVDGNMVEEENEAIVEIKSIYDEDQEDYSDEYDDDYYQKYLEEQAKLKIEARKLSLEIQKDAIAKLFKKGFVAPTSQHVNNSSDISAWLDYNAMSGKMNSFYAILGKPSEKLNPQTPVHAIKALRMDVFFENDKARMKQSIEYTPELASIMEKVIKRKPSQNFYKYFPKTEPLAYFTYHFSTEEMLKNYPSIVEQSFASLPIEKEDADIVLDLVMTMLDEEATATLLDGDFAVFFHAMEKYEHTFTSIDYDDDFEEIEVEKTIVKTKPIFSFITTSTHPKMSEKLLKLGVRKKFLTEENGIYKVKSTEDLGDLFIVKDGDVVVFTNGLDYLNKDGQSEFSNKVATISNDYYFSGNLNIQDFIKSYLLVEDFGKDTAKALRFAEQFRNVDFKSSNQVIDNKINLELNLNSNFSNKNIVLQTLDFLNYMN